MRPSEACIQRKKLLWGSCGGFLYLFSGFGFLFFFFPILLWVFFLFLLLFFKVACLHGV